MRASIVDNAAGLKFSKYLRYGGTGRDDKLRQTCPPPREFIVSECKMMRSCRLEALLIVGLVFICSCHANRQIVYLSHYKLSEEEVSQLPRDVAKLAQAIQAKAIDLIPTADRNAVFSRCPVRQKGKKRDRLIWGLDGKKPNEGDRCIWVDLSPSGEIMRCGLVIVG